MPPPAPRPGPRPVRLSAEFQQVLKREPWLSKRPSSARTRGSKWESDYDAADSSRRPRSAPGRSPQRRGANGSRSARGAAADDDASDDSETGRDDGTFLTTLAAPPAAAEARARPAMLKRMDEDDSGSVSLSEFRHMEKKAQTILSPCYIVQVRQYVDATL